MTIDKVPPSPFQKEYKKIKADCESRGRRPDGRFFVYFDKDEKLHCVQKNLLGRITLFFQGIISHGKKSYDLERSGSGSLRDIIEQDNSLDDNDRRILEIFVNTYDQCVTAKEDLGKAQSALGAGSWKELQKGAKTCSSYFAKTFSSDLSLSKELHQAEDKMVTTWTALLQELGEHGSMENPTNRSEYLSNVTEWMGRMKLRSTTNGNVSSMELGLSRALEEMSGNSDLTQSSTENRETLFQLVKMYDICSQGGKPIKDLAEKTGAAITTCVRSLRADHTRLTLEDISELNRGLWRFRSLPPVIELRDATTEVIKQKIDDLQPLGGKNHKDRDALLQLVKMYDIFSRGLYALPALAKAVEKQITVFTDRLETLNMTEEDLGLLSLDYPNPLLKHSIVQTMVNKARDVLMKRHLEASSQSIQNGSPQWHDQYSLAYKVIGDVIRDHAMIPDSDKYKEVTEPLLGLKNKFHEAVFEKLNKIAEPGQPPTDDAYETVKEFVGKEFEEFVGKDTKPLYGLYNPLVIDSPLEGSLSISEIINTHKEVLQQIDGAKTQKECDEIQNSIKRLKIDNNWAYNGAGKLLDTLKMRCFEKWKTLDPYANT